MQVQFTVTDTFKEVVDIKLEDYKPAYGGTSVGLDLYCVKYTIIFPVESPVGSSGTFNTLIPTGIKLKLPPYAQGLILERGSITKTPLKVRAGVIDPSYTGEVFINCINLGQAAFPIKAGTKLPFQLVCTPILQIQYMDQEAYQAETKDSIRGTACLGSSDAHTN